MKRLGHGCFIQTHHLPVPHSIIQHHLIPISWQLRLYGEVKIEDRVPLCPTHHFHAHLALEAAVGQICFSRESVFDRRQFGRELWGWAEDSALWLRERLGEQPELDWSSSLPTQDTEDPPLPFPGTLLP